MKKVMFCAGLVLIFGVFGFGQKQKGVVLDSGTQIDGQLQSSIDVKKSKAGDQVILKTTKSIKQNGETVIQKGSNLIGRITEVQETSKANGASRLGMVFDRIEGKNLSAPISASIVSITNATASGSLASSAGDVDLFGTSSTSARTTSSGGGGLLGGGGNSGGGLVSGVSNTAGAVTSTTRGVLNTTTQTAGNVTSSVGQTVGTTAGSLVRNVNGIQISNSLSGSAQSGTTLSSADRNIRLEKGTTIQLQLNNSVRGH